ncbi:MAG: hypothetical protein R3E84_12140 [Pseudomonadales bacterium]
MNAFKSFLVVLLLVVGAYTAAVIANHGINLFPDFFGDMSELGWPGQFNLDFMFCLMLSALWTAWRNRFSGSGLALALAAFFLGAPFLAAYLLVLLRQTDGDMVKVLIGDRAN